jgi:hypothetical protein
MLTTLHEGTIFSFINFWLFINADDKYTLFIQVEGINFIIQEIPNNNQHTETSVETKNKWRE